MAEPKREPGIYRVRFKRGKWHWAEWFNGAWWCAGIASAFTDESFAEIGPAIPQPGAAGERERELEQ